MKCRGGLRRCEWPAAKGSLATRSAASARRCNGSWVLTGQSSATCSLRNSTFRRSRWTPAAFENLAVEGEFGIRIGEDVPDPDGLVRHPERAIAEVSAVMELHNNVFCGASRTVGELIANNALRAGVLYHRPKDQGNWMTRSLSFGTENKSEHSRRARFPAACSHPCSASQHTSHCRAVSCGEAS